MQKIYQKLHEENSAYRNNNQGMALKEFWQDEISADSVVLEVGCGNGKLCQHIAECGCSVTGLDFINGIYDRPNYSYIRHDITIKPWSFGDKEFDVVLCFDVLEHIEEKDLANVISEMERVGHKAIMSIAHYGNPKIHSTIKSYDWWLDILKNWQLIKMVSRYRNVNYPVSIWKYRCQS